MVTAGDIAGGVALEVEIAVPPERVWRALTTAEEMVRFIHGAQRVVAAGGLGGFYEIEGKSDEAGEYAIRGQVIEYDAPRRLAFTWTWGDSRLPETTVRFTLAPTERGTKVSVVHNGLPAGLEQVRPFFRSGWESTLGALKQLCEAST